MKPGLRLLSLALIGLGIVGVAALSTSAEPPAPVQIITLGDSITKGVRGGVTAEQTFAHLLEAALRKQGLDVRVTNVGIGGERTDQALQRLDTAVLAQHPRLVSIMYGTNDSYVDVGKSASRITREEYATNLRQLVARLRNGGAIPVLMTEPRWGASAKPNGAGEHPNVRLAEYMAACRDVAKELAVPLVDHYQHWSDAEAQGQDLGKWTTDQCHPNPAGHEVLTASMLPVIQQALRMVPSMSQ